ncbi:glycosyl hydrolase family 43 protein [Bisporella sp. PMI_857]|nr:glycosyl hydrolase family 43 protein [Bisporella sp. PMI_857]
MLKSTLLSACLALARSACAQGTFNNPVIYADYPDNDVSVGPDGAFYFSASNFHYSPGAPILRSEDLVNWEPVGHSIPRLDFGDGYNLPDSGQRSYRGGTWASTLRYRKSNGRWYWIGCTNFWITWVFSAPAIGGPWEKKADFGGGLCMYDNGLLVDDDDTLYVVYGNPTVSVAQLAADGLSVVKTQAVLSASDVGVDAIEGNRLYKINGTYYILNDRPGSTTYIWKSSSPFGPYQSKILVDSITSPLPGGSSPHQGSIIQTKNGKWYYMSFTWAYPSGRLPVLAPITWGSDGFPVLTKGQNGGWGASYPLPLPAASGVANWTGTDTFRGTSLGPKWEWNHNPDVNAFKVNNGLTLSTSSVTQDIYSARNTLTHRIHGEFPVGTVEIDFSNAADGDRFGLAAFRDRSSYIGIHRVGSAYNIVANFNITMDSYSGQTLDLGSVVATTPLPSGAKKIWFRAALDARPNGTRAANFYYSTNGKTFSQLGGTYGLYTDWAFFLGYRFGVFNFATKALGGSVKVLSFTSA